MGVILTNSLRKPISCRVYVTGSTNLTTRVKSVCEKRLWGVVAIKKVCELPVRVAKMEGGAMESKKVSVKRKLNVLTVKKKFEIFEAVDKGGKKGQIAKDFKIPASTLSTILKNREKIKRLFELKKGSMKKIRIEILN
ncbi:hypothetical protein AVEN_229570-1 [Araneus ventricosus]|uniref:HTH psq-type domain-containing protein n=1 Tax=Araneus ventricosus TaxID=182803 RepID=A0A4Y2GG37_ARAVE|nr:hypothetical protein AVEN_229570-1 [Araneus ventricosus]